MKKKKLRLKPSGVLFLVLSALVLLLGIQDVVLISRNQTLKNELVSQKNCEDLSSQVQGLNDQISKLSSENQQLMETNIELQTQLSPQQAPQDDGSPVQITTDDSSATEPDLSETGAVSRNSDSAIEDPYAYIENYESQYNLSDPTLFRAIMILETGWFTSNAYVNGNNPCGATGSNGVIYYDSKDAGFSACYANWDQRYNGKTIEEIAPIYAPGNTEYVGKVMSIYNQLTS